MKTCKTRKCGTTISNHKIGSKEYRTVAIWRLYINKSMVNIEILWLIIRKHRKSYGKGSSRRL